MSSVSLCLEHQIGGRQTVAVTASLARMEATITTVDGKFGNPGRAVLGEAGFAARRTSPLASKLVRVQVENWDGQHAGGSPPPSAARGRRKWTVSMYATSPGGALPVIMSIIGPRETHDYRNYNHLGSGTNTSNQKNKQT